MREVVGDPQPTIEACQNFLEDVHSTCDLYAQEHIRTENQLFAAQQTITALTTQLRIADKRLSTIEDLVGEVRTRMQSCGLATHLTVCEHASCYARANLPRTIPKSYWSWPVANHKGSRLTCTVVSPNTDGVHILWCLYACLVKTEVPD